MVWFSFSIDVPAEYEFDEAKSQLNQAKHGIDFVAAQRIWDDEQRVALNGRSTSEDRWIIVGRLDDKFYSAVITWRGANVRIISVRRSRLIEVKFYEDSNS